MHESWRIILELKFVTFIRTFFGHSHVTFPYKEVFSLFGQCHVTFPNKETISFFGKNVQKEILFLFQIHLLWKRLNNQMAALTLQLISSYYTIYSENSVFIPPNTYEKYLVSIEYCIARHAEKMCFLPNCRYHFIPIGDIKELLQKLDASCFNYQHVDSLSTIPSTDSIAKLLSRVDNFLIKCIRRLISTNRNRGVDEMPRIAKKRRLRKRYEKNLFSYFQNSKLTQICESIFADRKEEVKKSKLEIFLVKTADCFLGGHGNYTSALVTSWEKIFVK